MDTTMRLYIPATPNHSDRFLPSYEYEFQVSANKLLHYEAHWAIDMPSDNNRSDRVCFITLRTVAAAEVMCGRATLVWEAILYAEKDSPLPGIYIIKQCWRAHSHTISEGEVYDIDQLFHTSEGPNTRLTNRKYSSEDVMIGDKFVTTLDLIRQGITPEPLLPAPIKSTDATDIQTAIACTGIEPIVRVLSRIALKIWGWPIQFFRGIPELLRVFRDVIEDHYMLILKGILHRNISPGNIIISPTVPSVVETRGYLTDFDHIKQSQNCHTVEEIVKRQNPCSATARKQVNPEDIQAVISTLHNFSVDRDVATKALTAFPLEGIDAVMYIETVKAIHEIADSGTTLTSEDLRWNELNMKALPTFEDYQPTQATPIGTLSFMSAEVITCKPLYQDWTVKPPNFGKFIHQGIHDMDSVLSTLWLICITQKGPGGVRREELTSKYDDVISDDSEDSKRIKNLQDIVHDLFNANDSVQLQDTKWHYFIDPALMDAEVLGSFHPNFEALKPLAKTWYTILRHAYIHSCYEYYNIHRHFLTTLDEFIQNFDKSPPTFSPEFLQASAVVDQKRQDYLETLLTMFKLDKEAVLIDVEEDQVLLQSEEMLPRRKRRRFD